MKICLVLEGSYPYVHGGVSTWMHQYLEKMKEHEFVLWVIGADSRQRGKFVYRLPSNVVQVQEVFLNDALKIREQKGRMLHHYTEQETAALAALIECGNPDWNLLFDLYQKERLNPLSYLKSTWFLEILTEVCRERYPYIAFADAFHTIRSMLLPVLYLLGTEVPEADAYHAISTGYGGLLASLGSYLYEKPLLLTEHGIYTREREEEIIRAKWVMPAFKKHWIRFFYMLSSVIYQRAFRITSLFSRARAAQIEMGCDPERCRVIGNGIFFERMAEIPLKKEDGWIDIGAIVRLAPIKDVKTMIHAFYELCARRDRIRLHIMGGTDDEEYGAECRELVEQLEMTEKILFTGRVDIAMYMEKLDFTILTSISEGQPLSVLESLAACRPCVTTDVGCCKELLYGEQGDESGAAGYCVPPMYREGLAEAMEKLCASRERRIRMGRNGQKRVERRYRHEQMMEKYRDLYREVETVYGRNRV